MTMYNSGHRDSERTKQFIMICFTLTKAVNGAINVFILITKTINVFGTMLIYVLQDSLQVLFISQ